MPQLKGFNHNSLHSKESLETARKFFESKASFSSTANFRLVYATGHFVDHLHNVCHRAITTATAGADLVATECGWNRTVGTGQKKTKDLVRPFLLWFLNDTPYGHFVVNRDDPEWILDNGFIVSTDVPAPLLQNVMIITRHFHEVYEFVFRRWNSLVETGTDPALAYSLLFNTGYSCYTTERSTEVFASYCGHRAHPAFDFNAIRRFKDGDVGPLYMKHAHTPDLNDPRCHYRHRVDYKGGLRAFITEEDGYPANPYLVQNPAGIVKDLMKDDAFKAALSAFRKQGTTGESYRPPNPFLRSPTKPTLQAGQVTYEEVFEMVVPYVKEKALI